MNNIKTKFIIDEKGNKTDVIMPIDEYNELIEDLHDLAIIAERREEPEMSFEEVKKRLKKNGVI